MTSIALDEECISDCSKLVDEFLTLSLEMAYWDLRPVEFEDPEAEVTVHVTSIQDAQVDFIPSYVPKNVDYVLKGFLIRKYTLFQVTFWMSKEKLLSQSQLS